MEFDAWEFVDGWSGGFDWEHELRNKTMTVEQILAQLRDLDRSEPTEGVDWAEVEEELQWIAR